MNPVVRLPSKQIDYEYLDASFIGAKQAQFQRTFVAILDKA